MPLQRYGLVAETRTAVVAPPDTILSRNLSDGGRVSLTLYAFDAGQALSRMTATRTSIVEILDGEAIVELGDDTHVVRAGAWMAVPVGGSFGIRATTPMTITIAVVMTEPGDPA